ncbi:MAG: bifunctional glycosyltransferase family 2/GtrA family protein [Bryobacteraceae bacterium]|nr:bifunctional glycosyltransferase family 2/GtrA family protein [Bryobacteraceae bacterium]
MLIINIPILIPAYQPSGHLVELVEALKRAAFHNIVVVNDGSGPGCERHFEAIRQIPGVHVVRHFVNLGKGAALRTGMNHALVVAPDAPGVVTADADGQHHPDDILEVAKRLSENPEALVLGVRTFGKGVPMRSRVGNDVTRVLLWILLGQNLRDTQTGLRGIPSGFVPHLLRLTSSGYEFELDMLLACKYQARKVIEEPIRTIYLDENKSSHFHPLFDSMRIYFLMFRFSLLSLFTAVLDNVVFAICFSVTGQLAQSQIVARVGSMLFNYAGARTLVFHSRQSHATVLPKYIALVCLNVLAGYLIIRFAHEQLGYPVIPSKIAVECLLFLFNFLVQRDHVFSRRPITQSN